MNHSLSLKKTVIQLGPLLVDPARNIISSNSQERHIEPKLMDLVVRLCEANGNVVSRNTLLDDIWGQHLASDEALTQAISKLRRTFNQLCPEQTLIETIPKKGYRIAVSAAPVTDLETFSSAIDNPNKNNKGIGKQQTRLLWLAIVLLAGGLIFSQFSTVPPKTEIIEIELINDEQTP